MTLGALIQYIIKKDENIGFIKIMVDMAYLAGRDGFNKEIIVAFFLFRIGYIVEINNLSYCSYKLDYGTYGAKYLTQLGVSPKIIYIVKNYTVIKEHIEQKEQKSQFNKHIINSQKEINNIKKSILYGLFLHIEYYESQSLNRINNNFNLSYDFIDKLNYYINLSENIIQKQNKIQKN